MSGQEDKNYVLPRRVPLTRLKEAIPPSQVLPPHVRPLQAPEVSDPLVNIDEIVGKFGPKVPEAFKKQAQEVTRFVLELDRASGLTDPVIRRFLSQLSQTEYIKRVQGRGRPINVDPAGLPFWLQLDFLTGQGLIRPQSENLNSDQRRLTQGLYDEWIESRKRVSQNRSSGRYDRLSSVGPSRFTAREFKVYIEQKDIIDAISDGSLAKAVEQLNVQNLGPNTMKLSDGDSLVIYFGQDVNVSEDVEKVLSTTGIKYRGPAQDLEKATIDQDGNVSLFVAESNDNSFMQSKENGGHRYAISLYTPQAFLEDYLSLCFKVGKNPAIPYLTSFLYLNDYGGKFRDRKDEFVKRTEVTTGYPVVYVVPAYSPGEVRPPVI